MEATVLDLRKNMRSILAAVGRNEHVTLTYRGRKKAVIVPFKDEKKDIAASQHRAFGMWADRDDVADVDTFVRKLRKGRQF